MAKKPELPPVHPGEILREEFMQPLGLSMNQLGRNLRVPVTRIAEIVHERRGISADTALRLARYFGTTPDVWLNLQKRYEIQIAAQTSGDEIQREVQPRKRRLTDVLSPS